MQELGSKCNKKRKVLNCNRGRQQRERGGSRCCLLNLQKVTALPLSMNKQLKNELQALRERGRGEEKEKKEKRG